MSKKNVRKRQNQIWYEVLPSSQENSDQIKNSYNLTWWIQVSLNFRLTKLHDTKLWVDQKWATVNLLNLDPSIKLVTKQLCKAAVFLLITASASKLLKSSLRSEKSCKSEILCSQMFLTVYWLTIYVTIKHIYSLMLYLHCVKTIEGFRPLSKEAWTNVTQAYKFKLPPKYSTRTFVKHTIISLATVT